MAEVKGVRTTPFAVCLRRARRAGHAAAGPGWRHTVQDDVARARRTMGARPRVGVARGHLASTATALGDDDPTIIEPVITEPTAARPLLDKAANNDPP
jgi:hypothetical protein